MNQLHRNTVGVATVAAFFITGCAASLSDDLQTVASELTAAQCTFNSDREAAQTCFTAFDACKVAENADVEACKATLKSCLPPPPERARGGGAGGGDCGKGGDGGVPHDRGGGAGGPPPGGEGERGKGGQHGGGRGPGGGGDRGQRPVPDEAAITACHDALSTCLSDVSTTSETCFQTQRDCIHTAFDAAFQARCDEAELECSTSTDSTDACTKILERCAAGVSHPPVNADGGVACE